MLEVLHITAQYSNAVLIAALPCVSQFATKANLPTAQAFTASELRCSRIVPIKDHTDIGIWFKSGYWFHVSHSGFVDAFHAPMNYFWEQDADVTKYAGKDNMTTNDAIVMARDILVKLSYNMTLRHFNGFPTLEGPDDSKQGHMPYCRVKWEWPKQNASESKPPNFIYVDINTETKSFVGMELFLSSTDGLPAHPFKIDIKPELERDFHKKQSVQKMFFDTNALQQFEPNKNFE